MKSPPKTGSSGSSPGSKELALHPKKSGVTKSPTKTKKAINVIEVTEGKKPQEKKKWQKFLNSAHNASADTKTVQALLFNAIEEGRIKEAEEAAPTDNSARKEDHLKDEAEEVAHKDKGESSEYDVRGLMAQIYQDLHNVAANQYSRGFASDDEDDDPEEASRTDDLLREVSAGVKIVIKSAFAWLYSYESPAASAIWDDGERIARIYDDDVPASYERYGMLLGVQGHHDWQFLSKLAHSTILRETISKADACLWQLLCASIKENAVSLSVFVENSCLEWWYELSQLNHHFPPPLDFNECVPQEAKTYIPHQWVVAPNFADMHHPTCEGTRQSHTPSNIYRLPAFEASKRPSYWPAQLPYPSDPTRVHISSSKPCLDCESKTPCLCLFSTNSSFSSPLVELRHYGSKGVGVRALQRIEKGQILGEYVGEVYPPGYAGDTIYALDFSLPGRPGDEVVAIISAKKFGNWTRFINHSCDASTHFGVVVQGGRYRSVVQCVRDIEMFEEVTVDYGFGYWRNKTCECGVEGCYEERKKKMKEGAGGKGKEME